MAQRRSARRTTMASTIASQDEENQPKAGSGKFSTECSLFMECEEEPLSEAQKNRFQQQQQKFKDQMAKLEKLASKGGTVTMQSDGSAVIRTTETVTAAPTTTGTSVTTSVPQPAAPTTLQAGYRLLMDTRTGRILGTINGAGQPAGPAPVRPPAIQSGIRLVPPAQPQPPPIRPHPPVKPPVPRPAPDRKVSRPAVVDLTRGNPGSSPGGSKQKEWPCLCVIPKLSKPVPNVAAKRSELDSKVKGLLVQTAAKFAEWLIQQSLVPTEQSDSGVKLKLGMYSDTKRFPTSGGYVWISETNPNQFVSVFKGSLFEGTSHSPTVILKLIYHWCCQTNINVSKNSFEKLVKRKKDQKKNGRFILNSFFFLGNCN